MKECSDLLNLNELNTDIYLELRRIGFKFLYTKLFEEKISCNDTEFSLTKEELPSPLTTA